LNYNESFRGSLRREEAIIPASTMRNKRKRPLLLTRAATLAEIEALETSHGSELVQYRKALEADDEHATGEAYRCIRRFHRGSNQ